MSLNSCLGLRPRQLFSDIMSKSSTINHYIISKSNCDKNSPCIWRELVWIIFFILELIPLIFQRCRKLSETSKNEMSMFWERIRSFPLFPHLLPALEGVPKILSTVHNILDCYSKANYDIIEVLNFIFHSLNYFFSNLL